VAKARGAAVVILDGAEAPDAEDGGWLVVRATGTHEVETPRVASWIRGNELQLSGRVPGDYSGGRNGRDVAFLLAPAEKPPEPGATPATPPEPGAAPSADHRRVLLLVEGVNLYDAEYPSLVGVVRIPKDAIAGIDWGRNPPPQGAPDGDGLLLIRRRNDLASGLVMFVNQGRIVSAVPLNYTQIRLR